MKITNIVFGVDRTPVENLAGMSRVGSDLVRVPANIQWEPIEVKPHASLVISTKREDGQYIYTAKLTFKTCRQLSGSGRYAYRCLLIKGTSRRYRLIGSSIRPYPIITIQENMPENVTDNQLNEVTVTWQIPQNVPYITS